jgi:RNA polymerase sigma factor (sigma-70 family)
MGTGAPDDATTEQLAGRATRLALRTAGALVGSREEAADIAQEVTISVLGSLGQLREPAAFDAWVHRIAVRHTLRALKRHQRERRTITPLALLAEADEPASTADADRAAGRATRTLLAEAIVELPARQRVALALRYVHDLPDEQIAAALGCRTGTVHALLSRARASLRADQRLAPLAVATTGGRT